MGTRRSCVVQSAHTYTYTHTHTHTGDLHTLQWDPQLEEEKFLSGGLLSPVPGGSLLPKSLHIATAASSESPPVIHGLNSARLLAALHQSDTYGLQVIVLRLGGKKYGASLSCSRMGWISILGSYFPKDWRSVTLITQITRKANFHCFLS
jgi:hypothetical protein